MTDSAIPAGDSSRIARRGGRCDSDGDGRAWSLGVLLDNGVWGGECANCGECGGGAVERSASRMCVTNWSCDDSESSKDCVWPDDDGVGSALRRSRCDSWSGVISGVAVAVVVGLVPDDDAVDDDVVGDEDADLETAARVGSRRDRADQVGAPRKDSISARDWNVAGGGVGVGGDGDVGGGAAVDGGGGDDGSDGEDGDEDDGKWEYEALWWGGCGNASRRG